MTRAPENRRARRGTTFRVGVVAASLVAVVGLGGGIALAAGGAGAEPPVNDHFVDAVVLDTDALSLSGSTVDAGTEAGEAGEDALRTVWYRWEAVAAGTTLLIPASDAPPALAVYLGDTLDTLLAVPLTAGSGSASGAVGFDAVAGTVYTFRVATPLDAPHAAFQFTLWQPTPGGPFNDPFANALSLDRAVNDNGGTLPAMDASTIDATREDGETGAGERSIWFSWTVPNAGATLTVTAPDGLGLTSYRAPETVVDDEQLVFDEVPTAPVTVPEPSPVDPGPPPVAQLMRVTGPTTESIVLSGDEGTRIFLRVSDNMGRTFQLGGATLGVVSPDVTPPTITCDALPSDWQSEPYELACTASDAAPAADLAQQVSGLADAADATFTLVAELPEGASDAAVATNTRTVCDVDGNCATAGPYTPVRIDRETPVVSCLPAPATWISTDAVISCTTSDEGSGLASASDAAFTLTATLAAGQHSDAVAFETRAAICDVAGNCTPVEPATAMIDRVPPVVTCDAAPSGWQRDNVTVECTVTDEGSGLLDSTQATLTLATTVPSASADANAATAAVSVCDAAGNCVDAPTFSGISIDRMPPAVTCATPAAWSASAALEVACTATDVGSGLAASDAAFTLRVEIDPGSQLSGLELPAREVCDLVGNCVAVPPLAGIGLDDAAPAITCEATPGTWQQGPLTVACTADDGAGSGLADPADAAFALTANIADGTVSSSVALPARAVCDAVGNCATTPTLATGSIDRALPSVTCTKPAGTVFAFNVTVVCEAADAGSGLADPASARFTLTTDVGEGQSDTAAPTSTRRVCDLAGNCFVAGVGPWFVFSVDRAAPAPGEAPLLGLPGTVTVYAATPDVATSGIAVPFAGLTATSPLGAPQFGCVPSSSARYALGTTLVSCTARDAAGRLSDGTFSVRVIAAPELAPAGVVVVGESLPLDAPGFVGTLDAELDGTRFASLDATDAALALPASASLGAHTVVLRGVGADSQPRLVVMPVTLATHRVGEPVEPGAPGTPVQPGAGSGAGAGASPDGAPDAAATTVPDDNPYPELPDGPTESGEFGGGPQATDGEPGDAFPFGIIIGAGLAALVIVALALLTARRRRNA